MAKHLYALWTLAHIYRGNPVGVVRGYRDWLNGVGSLYGLRGEIRRGAA